MATTRTQLLAMVKRVFKRTDKDTEINEAINETLREMCAVVGPAREQGQSYMVLAREREEYPIPTNALRINHPLRLIDPRDDNRSSNNYQLEYVTKAEYDRLEPAPNADTISDEGRPTHYTIWERAILLTPLPDYEYHLEITFGQMLDSLDADGDQHPFDDFWNETIKAGALARVFAGMELFERANYWQAIYLNGYAGDEGYGGGLKMLRRVEQDTFRPYGFVKPNPL